MDTLRAMRTFVRTLELGSLSAAARELGTTQPTVSKLLAQLEQHLSVRLFQRSTTGLSPTEQGRQFYLDAKLVLDGFDAAVGTVQGMGGQVSGLLRINAPVGLGQLRINAIVGRFLAAHPAVEIELVLDDRYIDMVAEGVDIAFRLGGPLPPDVTGRHLATIPRFLAASPAYLQQRGVPEQPADLTNHNFVRFAWTPGTTIDLHRGDQALQVPVRSRYRVNNALAIREALVLDSGIAICPDWLIHDLLSSRALVQVLPGWMARSQDLYVLTPSRRYQPLRLKTFIDFTVEQFRQLEGFHVAMPASKAGIPMPPSFAD
jgi:DNA-binding transcriptional LysR family regulator